MKYIIDGLKKFVSVFLSKHFLIFVIIGFINTFNSTIISSLLQNFIDPNISFAIGYLLSLSIAYVLNSKINFKQNLDIKKYFKFCVSYIPNFIIQNIVVFVVYNILGYHQIIAYIIAAIIGIPVTFLLTKFFAFGRKNKP